MVNSIAAGIQGILDIVSDCTTESVVQWCALRKGSPPGPLLQSPAKQLAFLLGQLLTTDEPDEGREFGHDDWEDVVVHLRSLFGVYTERYSPGWEDFTRESIDDLKKRELAILAFSDYFQQTLLADDEQVATHIRTYLVPFDEQLALELGVSASDALTVSERIVAKLLAERRQLLSDGEPTTLDRLLSVYRIQRSELTSQYGETGEKFWQLYTIGRGEGQELEFPTERSIVEERPFIRVSEGVAIGCTLKEMLLSILTRGEAHLLTGPRRRKYYDFRATALEDHAAACFKQLLGESAQIHQNLFERPDSQNEHDIVALQHDMCLFVEAKASPVSAPFRDPDRAYNRLRREFKSKTGIQKGYEQANRLLQLLQQNDTVPLYDKSGKEVLQLPSTLKDHAFCICVTKDNHGPAATCLSFLLDKDPSQPYPWVVGILQLENMAEIWQYYRWGAAQLKSFLTAREKLHATACSGDELDYVGAYVLHCGLEGLASVGPFPVPINHTYSDIFDVIHDHIRDRAPAPRIVPVYPFESVRETLLTGESVLSMATRQRRIRVGRNVLCPCGSRVKWKRCHGMV